MSGACTLCPRRCGVARSDGTAGVCGVSGSLVRVARAAPHHWEEPCISGTRGSGTVFFSGCNLSCIYCQNREISRGLAGRDISVGRLTQIFLELQAKRVHNINLVTPSHYLPEIRQALIIARGAGLGIPVVYNTSAYEDAGALRTLEGLVDVYLPDMKYMDHDIAARYSGAHDYPETALAAIREMLRQTGRAQFDGDGLMRRGVLVRHLALPGCAADSRAVIKALFTEFGHNIYISIMNQYTPPPSITLDELGRLLGENEYETLVDFARLLGVKNGFIQEGGTVSESFIPPFDNEGVWSYDI